MALDKAIDSAVLDAALAATANAIRSKGGTAAQIAFDLNSRLGFKSAIDAIPTGGGSTPVTALSKGVNFIDYDGTVVEAWQTSEVVGKSALPSNPSHDGLTAQGWNWSLANIKSYIADYPDAVVWVGQMYITDDGKTRVYIHLEEGRLSPYLGLAVNGSVDIDWGDGTAHGTLTGTSTTTVESIQHTYASGGDYVIVLTVTGTASILVDETYGSQLLWKNDMTGAEYANWVYQNTIRKVEIGNNILIGTLAFYNCSSLTSVTIPNNVTSIGDGAFSGCYSLASVTIPNNVTSIGDGVFSGCYSLASITIPDSVASIGDYAFSGCSLSSVTIPSIVTSIGDGAFADCCSLSSVTIPSIVTTIGNNAFSDCYSLSSITIPRGFTSIGNNAFVSCYSLASVTLPSRITSISNYEFADCYSLSSVAIPSGVTGIGGSAFSGCYGLGFIKFASTNPPTVSNSNAWSNIPTDCIIYVPTGTLEAYTTETNYPNSRTYTYQEY